MSLYLDKVILYIWKVVIVVQFFIYIGVKLFKVGLRRYVFKVDGGVFILNLSLFLRFVVVFIFLLYLLMCFVVIKEFVGLKLSVVVVL